MKINLIPFLILTSIIAFNLFNLKEKTNQYDISGIQNLQHPKKIGDIKLLENYERIILQNNSFGDYLRKLEIKQENNIVYLHNGNAKINQNAQYCVLKLDVGNRDLQQCADAVIRLRAEYLFQQNKKNQIHFNFTSGDTAYYQQYADGFRANVDGNNVTWKKKAETDTSYKAFRKYMDLVFSYAGTASLTKELISVERIDEIEPGDVFIQTGQPYGHAIIVVDVAIHKMSGEKLFLLAQSYMPAQEIHILKNPINGNISPWYSVNFENELVTPEWTFNKTNLKRFKER